MRARTGGGVGTNQYQVKGRSVADRVTGASRAADIEDVRYEQARDRLLALGVTEGQLQTPTRLGSTLAARWMGWPRGALADDTVLAKFVSGALTEKGVMAAVFGAGSREHLAGTAVGLPAHPPPKWKTTLDRGVATKTAELFDGRFAVCQYTAGSRHGVVWAVYESEIWYQHDREPVASGEAESWDAAEAAADATVDDHPVG